MRNSVYPYPAPRPTVPGKSPFFVQPCGNFRKCQGAFAQAAYLGKYGLLRGIFDQLPAFGVQREAVRNPANALSKGFFVRQCRPCAFGYDPALHFREGGGQREKEGSWQITHGISSVTAAVASNGLFGVGIAW